MRSGTGTGGVCGIVPRAARRRQASSDPGTTRMQPRALRPRPGPFLALALALLLCSVAAGLHAGSDPIIEAVQQKLTERGFDPGPIDGASGWRTRGAIVRFQRSVGLPGTGQIDDATREALGVEPPAATPPEPGKEPESEAGTEDAPKAEAPRTGPGPEADADTSGTGALRSAPESEAGTEARPKAEAPRAEPAPKRAGGRRLSFATLGWHPPQTGAEALVRFNEIDMSPEIRRGEDPLVVPKGEFVFVLEAGERIPGFDCDPGAGRLSIEFIFSLNGPVIFTSMGDGGYCRMGFGIALEVGRTLEIRQAEWGETQYPRGTVRITGQGIEYVR